ncbi:unnamed protein product, partial [Mesorhabditis spiculigera]
MDVNMDEYLKAKGVSWSMRRMALTCDSSVLFMEHPTRPKDFQYEKTECRFVSHYSTGHLETIGPDLDGAKEHVAPYTNMQLVLKEPRLKTSISCLLPSYQFSFQKMLDASFEARRYYRRVQVNG